MSETPLLPSFWFIVFLFHGTLTTFHGLLSFLYLPPVVRQRLSSNQRYLRVVRKSFKLQYCKRQMPLLGGGTITCLQTIFVTFSLFWFACSAWALLMSLSNKGLSVSHSEVDESIFQSSCCTCPDCCTGTWGTGLSTERLACIDLGTLRFSPARSHILTSAPVTTNLFDDFLIYAAAGKLYTCITPASHTSRLQLRVLVCNPGPVLSYTLCLDVLVPSTRWVFGFLILFLLMPPRRDLLLRAHVDTHMPRSALVIDYCCKAGWDEDSRK